jgi:hypothetical protein
VIYLPKFAQFANDLLHGEKSGQKIGKMSNIAANDAKEKIKKGKCRSEGIGRFKSVRLLLTIQYERASRHCEKRTTHNPKLATL